MTPPTAEPLIKLAVGNDHACGIRESDRSIVCWGSDARGATEAPPGAWVDIAAIEGRTCALADDGSLTCWGSVHPNVPIPQEPPGTFVSIDGHYRQFCAIDTEGLATCWWYMGVDEPWPGPAGRIAFSKVSAGKYHACGIRADDGNIMCWGWDNSYGQQDVPRCE